MLTSRSRTGVPAGATCVGAAVLIADTTVPSKVCTGSVRSEPGVAGSEPRGSTTRVPYSPLCTPTVDAWWVWYQ